MKETHKCLTQQAFGFSEVERMYGMDVVHGAT